MKKHEFETIFTYNYVMNIQNGLVKVFGSRQISYSPVVNDYFVPRRTNRLYTTPIYGTLKSKFEVDY